MALPVQYRLDFCGELYHMFVSIVLVNIAAAIFRVVVHVHVDGVRLSELQPPTGLLCIPR
jgi:hypothetical protein